jgi:predicted nucleic acid-binding protein
VIFVDTGALLARYLGQDQYHATATAFWNDLYKSGESCFTSNFVLDETFTLLGRRAGYDFAAQRASNIYASRLLYILRPDQEDEVKAVGIFQKFAEHRVSFTDCISFALMRKENIKRVFSFDSHFRWAGFELWPR